MTETCFGIFVSLSQGIVTCLSVVGFMATVVCIGCGVARFASKLRMSWIKSRYPDLFNRGLNAKQIDGISTLREIEDLGREVDCVMVRHRLYNQCGYEVQKEMDYDAHNALLKAAEWVDAAVRRQKVKVLDESSFIAREVSGNESLVGKS